MTRFNNINLNGFRVLLVYANLPMEPLMPLGIAMLCSALKKANADIRVFDTTFYQGYGDGQKEREQSSQVLPVDYFSVGIEIKTGDVSKDFSDLIHNFKPGLIGFSCVEGTYSIVLKLLNYIKDHIPVIVGGSFASFAPEYILASEHINMVCTGEGEKAICMVADRLDRGLDISGIPNIWYKKDNTPVSPPSLTLADIDHLQMGDFCLFKEKRIYRPMGGKLYRMIPLEFSRGCPYHCTYCSSPSYGEMFKDSGKWLRFKSVDRIMDEIDFYVSNFNVEYFYFISETFLASSRSFKKEFYKRYRKYKIPFWFNTRPETITEDDIKQCVDIGCNRISLGVECGNEEYRKTMLKRNYSNAQVLKAVDILSKSSIEFSVNNMIGFPDETRELVFDTIKLNIQIPANNHTVSIFQPFKGTELYRYCIQKGYWEYDKLCSHHYYTPAITMPSLSKDEIKGLHRTFVLYVNMDRSYWPEIELAEKMTSQGKEILDQLYSRLNSYEQHH